MDSERSTIISPVMGACLIIVGALFLLGRLFNIGPLWPLFIIAPGILILFVGFIGGRGGAPLAVPGVLIAGTGTILLYQSITHNWQSWAYVWTLYPALLGAGLVLMGRLGGNAGAVQTGRRFIIIGLCGFVLLGLFFETAIFAGIGLGWPLILFVLGILLLLRGAGIGKHASGPDIL